MIRWGLVLAAAAAFAQPVRVAPPKPKPRVAPVAAPAAAVVAQRGFTALNAEVSTPSNGFRILARRDSRTPWVSGAVVIHAGAAQDPADRAGLADIAVRSLRLAAGSGEPGQALNRVLEQAGSEISAQAFQDHSVIRFRGVSDQFAVVAGEIARMLTAPAIEQEAIDAARAVLRNQIGARYLALDAATAFQLRQAAFGAAHSGPGYESLSNIGPEDVREFHRRHVGPANVVLAVNGDFDPAAVRNQLEKLLGGWRGAAGPRTAPKREEPAVQGLILGELQQAAAAGFALGRQGPGLGDAGAAHALILAALVGNTHPGAGRLKELSAANKSWALYGEGSWEAGFAEPGLWMVRGGSDPSYPTEALQAVIRELGVIQKDGYSGADFEAAKGRAAARWLSRFLNPVDRMIHDEVARKAGAGEGHAAAVLNTIRAANRTETAKLAQVMLDPARFHLVVLGNSTLMSNPPSTLREPVLKADLTIPAPKPLEIRTDAASLEEGKKLLARMRQALGGEERLAAVEDLHIVSEGESDDALLKVTDRWLKAGVLRQDQETPRGPLSVFYDGGVAWVGSRGGVVRPVSASLLYQLRTELFRVLPVLALSNRDPKRMVSQAGANILVVTGEHGVGTRIFLDEATGLPVRLYFQSRTRSGTPSNIEETWSEWKEWEGIKYPGVIVTRTDGRKTGEMKVLSVKVNSKLNRAEVEAKP